MGFSAIRAMPLVLLLCATSACSGTNLGNVNEEVDSREEMPGPGIFDKDGEPAFVWSNDKPASDSSVNTASASTSTSSSSSTGTSTANSSTVVASSAGASSSANMSDEKAEFEQFKIWNKLRTSGRDSAEYREFQEWLEYQKFKAAQ